MKAFASLRLGPLGLLASIFQIQGILGRMPGEQHARSGNAFNLQRERLTRDQVQGMSKMTQHLKRLDEGIDDDTSDYYLGYQAADQDTRWAKYFNDTPVGLSQEFMSGLESSPFPPGTGLNIQQAAQALAQPGYLQLENGFTVNEDGSMMLAIRTEQPPEFTGEMFDFWFSWHVNDTRKYKLWNPAQHQYAAIDNHFIADASTSQPYRERYWNITSFVDEWIGDTAYKLSIAFFDPRIMNFTLEDSTTGIETIIMGFVELFRYTEEDPTSMAQAGAGGTDVVLAHQIRKKPDGSGMEMRSRFFFGDLITSGLALVDMRDQLAHDLSVHCAIEMGHVGSFLPALFEEFKDDIPTGI